MKQNDPGPSQEIGVTFAVVTNTSITVLLKPRKMQQRILLLRHSI